MRLVNSREFDELFNLLKDKLPKQLLTIVTREKQIREAQLISYCSRWFPRVLQNFEERDLVRKTLDFYIRRGDIEKGPGGKYHCVPPYILRVGGREGVELILCGDPCLDANLQEYLPQRESSITFKTIYLKDGVGENSIPIGFDRRIFTFEDKILGIKELCERIGITFVQLHELEKRLPNIKDLLIPAESELTKASQIHSGFWEIYAPEIYAENRWRLNEKWRYSNAKLIRWRLTDDWIGERNARFFYHGGDGLITELGIETSCLWQLYLDVKSKNPRLIYRAGNRLSIPNVIPATFQQWIQACTGYNFYSYKSRCVFEMNYEIMGIVCERLSKNLGLQIKDNPNV